MLSNLTKENFNASLSRFSTAELESMVEKFPYFQEAHLLLAKKYQQENNYKFDQQLQLAALYAEDRELFYEIFNQSITAPLTQPETEKPEEQLPLTSVRAAEENIIAPVEEIKEPLVTTETPVVVAVTSTEIVTEETVTQPEQEITSVESSAVEEVETEAPVVVEQVLEKPFNMAEAHTFDEWLKAFTQPTILKTETKEAPLAADQQKLDEELEKLYLSNIPLDLKELVEEETHYSKGLDKFIAEQIEKKKAKPAAKETDDTPQVVTETMAQIYEQQKKYAKAIECYRQLALLHPEKNDFFAARINYLKPLL